MASSASAADASAVARRQDGSIIRPSGFMARKAAQHHQVDFTLGVDAEPDQNLREAKRLTRVERNLVMFVAFLLTVLAAVLLFEFALDYFLSNAIVPTIRYLQNDVSMLARVMIMECILIFGPLFFIAPSFFVVSSGVIFRWEGLYIASTGLWLNMALAFLIGRYAMATRVRRWMDKSKHVRSALHLVQTYPFSGVVALRFSAYPFALLNYSLGVSNVSFAAYMAASCLGQLHKIVLGVWVGSIIKDLSLYASGDRALSGTEWGFLIFSWSTSLLVMVLAIRWIRAEGERDALLVDLSQDGPTMRTIRAAVASDAVYQEYKVDAAVRALEEGESANTHGHAAADGKKVGDGGLQDEKRRGAAAPETVDQKKRRKEAAKRRKQKEEKMLAVDGEEMDVATKPAVLAPMPSLADLKAVDSDVSDVDGSVVKEGTPAQTKVTLLMRDEERKARRKVKETLKEKKEEKKKKEGSKSAPAVAMEEGLGVGDIQLNAITAAVAKKEVIQISSSSSSSSSSDEKKDQK